MAETATTAGAQAAPKRTRLAGIDGLRALAALWVVLFHVRAVSGGRIPDGVDTLVRSGSTGVSLFLVVSGCVLYLPFAAGRLERFATRDFLRRRYHRLVPTYYASIAVALGLAVAASFLGQPLPSATALTGQVAAHVLLVHQFMPATFYGLNGAYWSLGLEWEFYLMLPVLIAAIGRWGVRRTLGGVLLVNVVYRLGLAALSAAGVLPAHGTLVADVLPNAFPGRWGEFALGMAAAELYKRGQVGLWARRLRWSLPVTIPLAILTAGNPLAHLLYGLVFFTMLCLVLSGHGVFSRVVSFGPLVLVGTMSYSLYLIHGPVLGLLGAALRRTHPTPDTLFVELIAALPVVLIATWALFVAIERRSLVSGSISELPGGWLLSPTFPHRRHGARPAVAAGARGTLEGTGPLGAVVSQSPGDWDARADRA